VTVVNYFQTTENRLQTARFEGAKRQLTPRERVIGGIAGRAYVPVVDTAEVGPHLDTATYEVMVPISNPRTDSQIVEFACTVARERENGLVHIVHIVQTPEKMDFRYGAQNERIIESSEQHLERLREVTTAYDISCETSTVVSHKPYDQIVRSAARIGPDLVVIGWETDTPWVAGRPQSSLDELTSELPCDFVVLRARDLDGSKILVTTAGGPDSELSAEIAATLRNAIGSAVTILQVVDTPAEAQQAERVLEAWAAEHDLEDARITVDTSGDVETAIYEEAKDHTLVMIGATERGMLSRLVTDSLHMSVVNEVDASVLLAERPAGRSLSRRLFGLQ
jgi:Universal stress protein family.